MTTKQCTKCKEHKSLEMFYNHKDGKRPECKTCNNARRAACRRERRATDPAYHEREREYARRYYHEIGKARQFESGDRWVSTYTSHCRRVGVTPVVERFTWQDVVDEYGDKCSYCQHGAFEELDHYIPIKAGGPHALENVRPSCVTCNRTKKDSDPLVFAASSSAMDEDVSE